jgi:hypothetical protein
MRLVEKQLSLKRWRLRAGLTLRSRRSDEARGDCAAAVHGANVPNLQWRAEGEGTGGKHADAHHDMGNVLGVVLPRLTTCDHAACKAVMWMQAVETLVIFTEIPQDFSTRPRIFRSGTSNTR